MIVRCKQESVGNAELAWPPGDFLCVSVPLQHLLISLEKPVSQVRDLLSWASLSCPSLPLADKVHHELLVPMFLYCVPASGHPPCGEEVVTFEVETSRLQS